MGVRGFAFIPQELLFSFTLCLLAAPTVCPQPSDPSLMGKGE